jgi:steroid delta-isomerase
MNEEHPALLASRESWRCVQAHDKQGWLDLMAEDVCIEDPIGVAPTNPDGKGLRGKAVVSEFYETNIAKNELTIECHRSYLSASPLEAAHVLTLTNEFPNGVRGVVSGVFTYRVNEAGKLVSLRGYWDMDAMTLSQPQS